MLFGTAKTIVGLPLHICMIVEIVNTMIITLFATPLIHITTKVVQVIIKDNSISSHLKVE